jgi:hypothetical protein
VVIINRNFTVHAARHMAMASGTSHNSQAVSALPRVIQPCQLEKPPTLTHVSPLRFCSGAAVSF